MKVILLQDVKGKGKKGQLVEVSEGYGRNYLLPKQLAKPATADNINLMKQADAAQQRRLQLEKEAAQQAAAKLKEVQVVIPAKAGASGRLFGAVTAKEIAEHLQKQWEITIPKQKIVMDEPIKNFGTYQLKVKLHAGITGEIQLKVVEQ